MALAQWGYSHSFNDSLLPWQRTPTTNPFLTNSKKIRRSKRATNTHKHGRNSYLSDGTRGDSQSHAERDPLRSKDRAFFSYNIDVRKHFKLVMSLLSTAAIYDRINVNHIYLWPSYVRFPRYFNGLRNMVPSACEHTTSVDLWPVL